MATLRDLIICNRLSSRFFIPFNYDILIDKLSSWFVEFVRMLPDMALAALVFVLGMYLSKLIKRLANKLIRRISTQVTLNNLFASFVHILSVCIILFITLSILKLEKTVASLLAGVGIIGLALAFAFQDIAANFISGIFISLRRLSTSITLPYHSLFVHLILE